MISNVLVWEGKGRSLVGRKQVSLNHPQRLEKAQTYLLLWNILWSGEAAGPPQVLPLLPQTTLHLEQRHSTQLRTTPCQYPHICNTACFCPRSSLLCRRPHTSPVAAAQHAVRNNPMPIPSYLQHSEFLPRSSLLCRRPHTSPVAAAQHAVANNTKLMSSCTTFTPRVGQPARNS